VSSTATGHERAEEKTNRRAYLQHRSQKLARQIPTESDQKKVLENVRVYINGYLRDTTDIEMKRTVTLAGGVILQVQLPLRFISLNLTTFVCRQTSSGATHILTSQGLSGSKTHKQLTAKARNIVHVVTPEWITESIAAGKRLPERHFAIIKDNTTKSLAEMLSKPR
jgi:hypothetical protein